MDGEYHSQFKEKFCRSEKWILLELSNFNMVVINEMTFLDEQLHVTSRLHLFILKGCGTVRVSWRVLDKESGFYIMR